MLFAEIFCQLKFKIYPVPSKHVKKYQTHAGTDKKFSPKFRFWAENFARRKFCLSKFCQMNMDMYFYECFRRKLIWHRIPLGGKLQLLGVSAPWYICIGTDIYTMIRSYKVISFVKVSNISSPIEILMEFRLKNACLSELKISVNVENMFSESFLKSYLRLYNQRTHRVDYWFQVDRGHSHVK